MTENVPSDMCTSEDSDQPAHSRSLIRIFTERILDSQECKVSSRWPWKSWLSCTAAQADLTLKMPRNAFKCRLFMSSAEYSCKLSNLWQWNRWSKLPKCKKKKKKKKKKKTCIWKCRLLCRLLNILVNFSNLFLHTRKQCVPWSDCSWSGTTLFAKTTIKITSRWQSRRQLLRLTV